MPKLPFMQFFPADWLRDTRCLTPEARGVWIDLLCFLHDTEPRGSATLTIRQWASKLVVNQDTFTACLSELVEMGVCNSVTLGNGHVTVESRRITREQKRRESDRMRKARERSHESVTVQSHDGHGDIHIQKHIQKHIQSQNHIQKEERKENPKRSVSHGLQDRTTKGFESVGESLDTVFQTIAQKKT